MNSNGILQKHWLHISLHFSLDAVLFYLAALAATLIRFHGDFTAVVMSYWPYMMVTAVAFATAVYIFGLYSTHSVGQGAATRAAILIFCTVVAVAVFVAGTYLEKFHPIGRGVAFILAGVGYALTLAHHMVLVHTLRHTRERVAYIISCRFDELETRLFRSFGAHHLELAGVVEHNGYKAQGDARVLGQCGSLQEIVRREGIARVLCTNRSLRDPMLLRAFCELRYSGVSVMPLITLCEEVDQYVPLELLTSEWLLNASGEPHLLYIKKIKRLFDIVISALGLLIASPLLLLSMLLVKATSPGPAFYRQTRSGRFGRILKITKLRTMCDNAEKGGPVWSGKDDPRVTPLGRFLRKYRIDEIPQLFHVLMGEMSFVGPRPERPEIIEKLATEIPYYQERLMVQPGITGWAQVNYPYGSSVEDSRRKLEYDLYYMKNMSLFLDLFILLDTVRIVICGGASPAQKRTPEWDRAIEDLRTNASANEGNATGELASSMQAGSMA